MTDPIVTRAMRTRPFWGRILLIESPVEESERQSGLLVPIRYDGDDGVRRGVIVDVDRSFEDTNATRKAAAEALQPGTVVWFSGGGYRIGEGLIVLDIENVLAFETDE